MVAAAGQCRPALGAHPPAGRRVARNADQLPQVIVRFYLDGCKWQGQFSPARPARSRETRLAMLTIDRDETVAAVNQEREIANERARVLSEQQRYILGRRWEIEQEEISKAQALEIAQIQKEIAVIDEARQREPAWCEPMKISQ